MKKLLILLLGLILIFLGQCTRRGATLDAYEKNEFLMSGNLVSAEWLYRNIDDTSIVIVDARPDRLYKISHINGAVNLDWEVVLPYAVPVAFRLLPEDSLWVLLCSRQIRSSKNIVVYSDAADLNTWGGDGMLYWLFEFLKFENVLVLDGGLSAWIKKGFPISQGSYNPLLDTAGCGLILGFDSSKLATTEWLRQYVNQNGIINANIKLIDARDTAEFKGDTNYTEARLGRIPGARHFHWREGLNHDGTLRDSITLTAVFSGLGLSNQDTIVTYCTGGVRSGFVYFILKYLGYSHVRNYEGSFEEWSNDYSLPVQ
jgi:thiosulfate/3-mercaptopyruvate sulfurtransferase